MPKSPMEILDEKLVEIREAIGENIDRREELNNQLYELNLNKIELEHSKSLYEHTIIALKQRKGKLNV